MNSNIKFSIICPFFNTEKYLSTAIESVLSQSYSNFELILVNDGSSDSSFDIANYYAENDARIKLISIKNSGPYNARNEGIKIATGDYLSFLDSDDFVENNILSLAISEINKSKPDIIVFNYNVFSDGEESCKAIKQFNQRFEVIGRREIIECTYINYDFRYGLCGNFFNRRLFIDIENEVPKKIRYCEDLLLAYKLLKTVEKIVALPYSSYNYRMNQSSVTHNLCAKDHFEKSRIFLDIYEDIEKDYPSIFLGKIDESIFWAIFNYVMFTPKKEEFKTFKNNCTIIRNNDFYKKYIKRYRYNSKKVRLIKMLFNLKIYYFVYLFLK